MQTSYRSGHCWVVVVSQLNVDCPDCKGRHTKAPELSKERKLSLCVESWDAATHMSKQDWRVACQRSIKDYPDAFER